MDHVIDTTATTEGGNQIGEASVGARRVDTGRGSLNSTVSRQWFSRPDDQRFTDLNSLIDFLNRRTANAREDVVEAQDVQMLASKDDIDTLRVGLRDGTVAEPTNWSFGQACGLAKAPAGYLKTLPAFLAAVNLQYGLSQARDLPIKMLWDTEGGEMRAITGPDYGRINDIDLARVVQRIAGSGRGEMRWKVPGLMNWRDMTYNPYVDVSKETTTLFASDRDLFLFLVDDTHPIEIGKLPNGDPDLIFRGFYAWNSEVGSKTLGISTFWLRAVCQNRNLWGVEDMQEMTIRHTKFAPDRFTRDAAPALERYANSDPTKLLAGIKAARDAVVVRGTDDMALDKRRKFLHGAGFAKNAVENIIATIEREEGRPAESVLDFVHGITAVARTLPHQDARLDMEKVASKLMDRATRGSI